MEMRWRISFAIVFCLASLLMACGEQRPRASLTPLNGNSISFQSLEGKWVIFNYWASWCHPCFKEIPELNAFYKQTKDTGVVLYGVNYDHVSKDTLEKIIKKMSIDYPNLIGDPAKSLGLGNIPGLPATYIFDPKGRLVKKLYGQQTVKSLTRAIGRA